jgi:hypothetical protein
MTTLPVLEIDGAQFHDLQGFYDEDRAELDAAREGLGPTLFDILVQIIEIHGPDGSGARGRVELQLA